MESEIHLVQAKILRELLFKPQAKFSQLNMTELSNDHFTFHLNKLLELGFVEKINGRLSSVNSDTSFVC